MPIYDCTLWEMLKSPKLSTLEERISIILKCLDGLMALQSEQLLHLDVKPSNVALQRSDDGNWDKESVVLIDFGLASDFEILSGRAGTPGYGSPEQFLGTPSQTSDNFAAGKLAILTMFPWDTAWDYLKRPIKDGETNEVIDVKNDARLTKFYKIICKLLDVSFYLKSCCLHLSSPKKSIRPITIFLGKLEKTMQIGQISRFFKEYSNKRL